MDIERDDALLAAYREHAVSDLLPFWWKAVDTQTRRNLHVFRQHGRPTGEPEEVHVVAGTLRLALVARRHG